MYIENITRFKREKLILISTYDNDDIKTFLKNRKYENGFLLYSIDKANYHNKEIIDKLFVKITKRVFDKYDHKEIKVWKELRIIDVGLFLNYNEVVSCFENLSNDIKEKIGVKN
jgi:hypothetical protein